VRLWCSPKDVDLAERPAPCSFIETVYVSFPHSREVDVCGKTESLVMMPLYSAFTAADNTDVQVAFYGGESTSSCPRSSQLCTPNKKELPDEKKSQHQENVSLFTSETEFIVASQPGQEAL